MRNLIVAVMCALAVSACATNNVSNPAKPVVAPMAQQVEAPPANVSLTYATRVQPIYPGFDVVYGIQGTAVLMLLVNSSGQVIDIRVDKSAGERELDRAAINAARQWHFFPERKNGVSVPGYARVPVNFSLGNPSVPSNWPANYVHPRYVLDTHPIPYASVDDALLAVSTAAHEPMAFSPSREIQSFIIRDNKGATSDWWVFTDMDTEYATAIRYVFAGTPAEPELRVSTLCRSGVAFCDSRISWLLRGPVFVRNSQPSAASSP